MDRDHQTMPKGQFSRFAGLAYDVTGLAVAVPLAFVMRTGGIADLDRSLLVLGASFVVIAAAGFWGFGVLRQGLGRRTPVQAIAAICLSTCGAMIAALVVMLALKQLDAVPRSIPLLAIMTAIALTSLPRLLSAWPSARQRLRQGADDPGGTMIGVKQWTDILIVTCLPTAVVMAMVGPQGLTWFCTILAVLMLTVLALETDRADISGMVRPLWPLLAALALVMAWAVGRSIASTSISAALPILAAFGLALLSAIGAGVAAYRIRPGRHWYWVFFPAVQIMAAVLLALALFLIKDNIYLPTAPGRLGHIYHYNRLALFVVLLYPLSLFAIRQMDLSRSTALIVHLALAAAFASTFMSASESAVLALVVVVTVHLASKVSMRWTKRLVMAGSVGLVLLAPIILHGAFLLIKDSSLWTFRPGTFAVRMLLWEDALALVRAAPFFGNGVEIIRVAGVRDAATQAAQMHHHPHSFLLQTWVDLGLIGAVLMALCLVAVFRLIKPIEGEAASMFLSLTASILTIWAVSHGMWQSWYVGLSGIVVVFAILAYRRSLPAS
jgi:hypothetical protein